MDYLYKVEIELDDEKIISEGKYELADIYEAIRKVFKHKHISEVKSDSRALVFSTKKYDKYGDIWAGINSIYLSIMKPYITKIIWYDLEDEETYSEDVLAVFKREGL